MKKLEQMITRKGSVLPGDILKVDSFLNHQIDPDLMADIGKEFHERFQKEPVTRVLTIETGGIAPALFTALQFSVPCVFARKEAGINPSQERYATDIFSYTKQHLYNVSISKEYLQEGDSVLIVDDFMANGKAVEGMIDLCHQAGAHVAGIGIVIEKEFQEGGRRIREKGYRVESLACIRTMSDSAISFRVQKEEDLI
ncbi:MAG: xanthine phosphoribosyltransferase [Bulleidia sp.]